MAQTFTQGLSMGSTMGLLLVHGLRHHKMQFESCSPEAIIGGKYSLFASQGTPRMHISFTPADEAFRQEVRQFIADCYPKELKGRSRGEFSTKEDFLAWHKILFKQGWVAPSWPKQYGGTGWTSTQKYIFGEECAAADTPGPRCPSASRWSGP
jgi:alkylation response protein AidB-like acyl-CoA dehydrogenase